MKPISAAGIVLAFGLSLSAGAALAQGMGDGRGPVGQLCTKEIAAFCKDKQHGAGAVRACLEARRADLSEQCRSALDGTGGGRGSGMPR
jgi:hypothetical protein